MASKHLGADFTLISVSLIVSLSRPFSFSLFFCLSPVLFLTLPSPWCPLVISTWNFPSCLILQSQSEQLLQDCTSPKFPPVLCPAPSAAVISVSSCHVVSSCQPRASLPETHICQRETCGYLCYAATYCGQTDPASPGVSCFILFQPSGLSVSQHALG